MSTKAVALLIALLACATILTAAVILDDGDPKPAPQTVDLCPPRLEKLDAC